MKTARGWLYRLVALVALAGAASYVQHDAVAQSIGSSSDYGLIANGGQPRVVMLTANYTATPSDCGTTFINSGAGATVTLTLPPAPTLGCVIGAYIYNGGFGMVIQNQSAEFIQVAGSSTASGGNITYAAGLGTSITLQKVTSTRWGTTANEGAAPTIN